MAQDELRRLKSNLNHLLDVLDDAEMHWGDALINGDAINGGDLVDWFAEWLPKVRAVMEEARASTGATA
jgi:hypothetical protein